MSDATVNATVQFWWPTHVLMRRYAAARDVAPHLAALDARYESSVATLASDHAPVAAFVNWLEKAATDLANATLQRDANMPALRLDMKRLDLALSGQTPRRTPATLFVGLYCVDPGTIDANFPEGGCVTFLDPRTAAEMIPGTSSPALTDQVMRPVAGQLLLFPGWLQHGYTAPVQPQKPVWIAIRFQPVLSATKPAAS